jgi:hypothetical protein
MRDKRLTNRGGPVKDPSLKPCGRSFLAKYSAACPLCDLWIAKNHSWIMFLPVPLEGKKVAHWYCVRDRAS